MESPRPTFSVIIPSYNHASYLGAALDSILAQTFTDWEIVIANDGSTDRTREVMDEYQTRDRRIRGFHKENGGVVSALNHALQQTRGRWICWLSSDDLYEPHALATHHRAIVDNPGISFFHSNYSTLDDALGVKTRQTSGWQTTAPPRHRQVIQWFLSNYVHGNSFAAKRSTFESVGLFTDAYRYAQDFDMWLRISARFPMKFIPEHTCVTRTHSGQTTHSFPQACFLDSARACVEFLNRTDFRSLFPGIDLNTDVGANQALQDSLQIALNPGAVIYCGGVMCPALLSRIREWLTRWAPSAFRTAAAEPLGQIVREVGALPFPDEFKTAVQHLAHLDQPYCYEQHDFLAAVNERAIRVTATDPETSQWLLRYLKHSQQFPVTPPPMLPALEDTTSAPASVSPVPRTVPELSAADFAYGGRTYHFCHNKLDPSGLGCIREIVANNEYLLERFENHRSVFVDIGANCGVATIILAKQNPDSMVYAFEPHTPTYHLLANNVKINQLTNVRCFNKAISKKGVRHLSLITHPGWSGGNTTYSDFESFRKHHPNSSNIHEITVPCLDIDSFCEQEDVSEIKLLKIDCEGAEYDILYNSALLKNGGIHNMVGEFHNLRYNTKSENRMRELHQFCRCHVEGLLKITFLEL